MFENILPGSQIRQMREAENRQNDFVREQNALGSTTNANSDMVDLSHQEEKTDLIKWQQDLEPELMDLVYKLKGWILIDGQWMKPGDCRPLCNDVFINKIVIPSCKPYLCRNMINTNLSEERILHSLKRTSNEIADNMCDGWDIYEIDFIDYDVVLGTIKTTIIPGAFRSLNGWTKKTDSTIFKRIESSFDNPNAQQKKTIFGIAR